MSLTHASFFSGVGGLDLGLERAGWRTVSFSEIDPYASAVLAERWPGVPNLGDIVRLDAEQSGDARQCESGTDNREWHRATLWSGGFPCQDLSVAGKRRGMVAGTRSNLAYAFLELVAVHRPRAILLENVPGLLSSHGGRDMAALLGTLVELGYGVGYRILDARHFGVPQRRRRVFIVGLAPGGRAGAERAAAVLSVGSRCDRHPPTGVEAGPDAAAGARPGVGDLGPALTKSGPGVGFSGKDDGILAVIAATRSGLARSVVGSNQYDDDTNTFLVSSSPDPNRVRAADGLAGRLDVVNALDQRRGGADDNEEQAGHLVTFAKQHRAASVEDYEGWSEAEVSPTLNDFDTGDTRAVTLALGGQPVPGGDGLPLGLDSHRYRCCGNGVVSSVAEWVGLRLAEALA